MLTAFLDPALQWSDIDWLRSITKMPIVLKGIQTGEDAVLAYEKGVAGIIVTNHGGRQLDYCRSGLECLEEVIDALRAKYGPGYRDNFDVFVDGGIRRGNDIFKALALGAVGVGLGRAFIYGLAAYGQEGVEKCIQILRDEFTLVMRLMGCRNLGEIKREMIITKDLATHTTSVGSVLGLHDTNYRPILNVQDSYEKAGLGITGAASRL